MIYYVLSMTLPLQTRSKPCWNMHSTSLSYINIDSGTEHEVRPISQERPTLNLPFISPQNSVTCNVEFRRPGIKAQRSFHGVEVDGGYVIS